MVATESQQSAENLSEQTASDNTSPRQSPVPHQGTTSQDHESDCANQMYVEHSEISSLE